MASGGMDTLPHNGAVITLLAVTGLTHRQSYSDIFAITCIKTAAVFVVIAVYYLTGLYCRQVQDAAGKGLRRLLRRVVARPGDHPALVGPGEIPRVAGRALDRADAVRRAMRRDGRHGDRGWAASAASIGSSAGSPGGVAEAVAVGLDHDVDEVRVVEGGGAGGEGGVVEIPVRRPEPPEQPGDAAPVGAPARRGRARCGSSTGTSGGAPAPARPGATERGDVLDVVAGAGDQAAQRSGQSAATTQAARPPQS